MEYTTIYGELEEPLHNTMEHLVKRLQKELASLAEKDGVSPAEHLKYRVKSDASMREKCRRDGLPETAESALREIHDAIGLRIICRFPDEVYRIRERIASMDGIEIITEKDYIRHVKENGYRSYHMIIRFEGFFAEIQIRTISMDTWAALEHEMRYKKNIHGNRKLIAEELKRCADELASTDAKMQTIRWMIQQEEKQNEYSDRRGYERS